MVGRRLRREVGEQEQWQLPAGVPELYQRHLVPVMTAPWAADLVERVAVAPGERVLDVACGTGVVARLAAQRAGPSGRVAALDLNRGMLAVARSLPAVAGAAIEWREGSALALPYPAAAFDVALCQLGLQFFPDRVVALREIERVLVAGGRLALNVFSGLEANPATHALVAALDRHAGPEASAAKRQEHALADVEALRALVRGAGLKDVDVRTATRTVRFASAAEYVGLQLTATPLAALSEGFDVDALVADVGEALSPYARDDGLAFPQQVHVATAVAARA